MRVVRSAGQNVSPSDDGRLYDQIFTDGLFEDTTITNLGANNIALGTLYGVICGRDFTAEAQTIAAVLPEGDTEETGYIYVEIDTSSDDVITINSALAPFTPTYEDINTNGAVVQMILAEYTASAVAVTSITPTYTKASAGTVLPGSVATVEQSQAVSNHSVGEYILLGGQLYKVTRAISAGETITPGSNVSATSAGAELNQLNNDLTIQTVTILVESQIANGSTDWASASGQLSGNYKQYMITCGSHAAVYNSVVASGNVVKGLSRARGIRCQSYWNDTNLGTVSLYTQSGVVKYEVTAKTGSLAFDYEIYGFN